MLHCLPVCFYTYETEFIQDEIDFWAGRFVPDYIPFI